MSIQPLAKNLKRQENPPSCSSHFQVGGRILPRTKFLVGGRRGRIAVGIFVLSAISSLLYAQSREPTETELLEQERKIEKDLEERVQNILDKVFGPNQSEVKATIKLTVRKMVMRQTGAGQQQIRKEESPLAATKFLLPGVPAPKNVAKEKEPDQIEKQQAEQERAQTQTAVKVEISNRKVTAFYNQKLEKKVPDAKMAVTKMTDLKEEELEFIPGKFFNPLSTLFEDLLRDPKNLLTAALLFLLLLLLLWLFVPLTSFFKNYIQAMKEKAGIEVKMESSNEEEELGKEGMTPEEMAEQGLNPQGEGGEDEMGEKKYVPFQYINEENLKRLLGVFRKEPPQVIALVLSYLKPELVKAVYQELPVELQTRVAAESAAVRQTSLEQVKIIDEDIKAKIDFLVGGVDNLISILEEVDYKIRENILEYLKDHKPQLYQKVRPAILQFEDIVDFPDLAMQTIIRELKTDQLARALKNASPEIMAKFTSNMSQGGQALLKEEMEFGRPVTEEQIELERETILKKIKEMEKEGKIVVREKKKISIFESEDATSPLMPFLPEDSKFSPEPQSLKPSAQEFAQVSEEPAQESLQTATSPNSDELSSYLAYGEALYNEGKYEEALPYLQFVIESDSSHAQAYQLMGHCYYGLGRVEEALQYYEFALSLSPEDESLRGWVEQLKQNVGV